MYALTLFSILSGVLLIAQSYSWGDPCNVMPRGFVDIHVWSFFLIFNLIKQTSRLFTNFKETEICRLLFTSVAYIKIVVDYLPVKMHNPYNNLHIYVLALEEQCQTTMCCL